MLGSILGQAGRSSVGDAVVWIVVLVACCLVFGVVLMKLRRHFLGDDDSAADAGVLPMAELRRMRDAGELTEDEYHRAVGAIASRAKSGGSGLGRAGDSEPAGENGVSP